MPVYPTLEEEVDLKSIQGGSDTRSGHHERVAKTVRRLIADQIMRRFDSVHALQSFA